MPKFHEVMTLDRKAVEIQYEVYSKYSDDVDECTLNSAYRIALARALNRAAGTSTALIANADPAGPGEVKVLCDDPAEVSAIRAAIAAHGGGAVGLDAIGVAAGIDKYYLVVMQG